MSIIRAQYDAVIDAPPEAIYAILRDYQGGHAAILPKPYFADLKILKGGVGAGTETLLTMKVNGRTMTYRQRITEPQPGRVIQETEINTGQWSRFTLEPLDGGRRTRVTISAEQPASPGVMGLLERLFAPGVQWKIFSEELALLAEYIKTKA
ncbi:MAG: SRPBCC family protein [Anaerolineae bacterium]|nr:SRPBCC family protein [Anaerolineae bacterium]NUQ05772.1 SRPBCC family protein [Anaerolineae bacterium]